MVFRSSVITVMALVVTSTGCGASTSNAPTAPAAPSSGSSQDDAPPTDCQALVAAIKGAVAPLLSGPKVAFGKLPKDHAGWADRVEAVNRVRLQMGDAADQIAKARDNVRDDELRKLASSYSEALTELVALFNNMRGDAGVHASIPYLKSFRSGKRWSEQQETADREIGARCKVTTSSDGQ